MGIYIEVLILYIILFLSGSIGAAINIPAEEAQEVIFSASSEIIRIVLYYIPAIALIWLLLLRGQSSIKKGDSYVIIDTEPDAHKPSILPVKNDLISGIIALPALLITGIAVAYVSFRVSGYLDQMPILLPSAGKDWATLCLTCFFAAYLEESFFRYYLLTKSKVLKMSHLQALIFSAALFGVCHIYEGQWGVLNAVISSFILGFLFLRYNAFHGIAIAHGLYNILVYVIVWVQLR